MSSQFSEVTNVPLCVDLDGTLVRTDVFRWSLFALAKVRPSTLILMPFWLLRGRAFFKDQVARRVSIDVRTLPYNSDFLKYLKKEHGKGRTLVLATAANEIVANEIAKHLGIFSRVLASRRERNLKSHSKARALVALYGEKGFDYAGNSTADFAVWTKARSAIVVNAARGTRQRARRIAQVEHEFT